MNADIIAFIEGGVSIVVSSRSEALEPSVARGSGCRVDAERQRLRIFCSRRAAAQVIADLSRGAPIAVTFSRPTTHRSLQLKAPRAALSTLEPDDWSALERCCDAFALDVAQHGHSAQFVKTVLGLDAEDAIGIELWPDEAFEQTPGRHAGDHLPVR